jgi:uncharacterized membrane protein
LTRCVACHVQHGNFTLKVEAHAGVLPSPTDIRAYAPTKRQRAISGQAQ